MNQLADTLRFRLFLFLWTAFAFLPLLLVGLMEGLATSLLVVPAIINCILIGGLLAYALTRPTFALNLLTVGAFSYLWMGIIPLLNVWTQQFPLYQPSVGTQTTALFAVTTGLMAYAVGYIMGRAPAVKSREIQKGTYWACFAIGMLMSLYALSRVGFRSLISLRGIGSVETTTEESNISSLISFMLIHVPPAVLCMVSARIIAERQLSVIVSKPRNVPLAIAALVLLFIYGLLANNPLAVPRMWFGSVYLTIFVLFFRVGRNVSTRIRFAWIVTIGILVMFSLFDVRQIYSILTSTDRVSFLDVVRAGLLNLPTNGDFDGFTVIAMTIDHVGANGLSWGNQLLLPLLFFVPRSIWPTKPVGSGYFVSKAFGLLFNNLSSPLWAEGYINFGMIGVFVFFFILGIVTKKLDLGMANSKGDFFRSVFNVYFAFNLFILLRGDLNTGTNYLIVVLAFMGLVTIVNRFRPLRFGRMG